MGHHVEDVGQLVVLVDVELGDDVAMSFPVGRGRISSLGWFRRLIAAAAEGHFAGFHAPSRAVLPVISDVQFKILAAVSLTCDH